MTLRRILPFAMVAILAGCQDQYDRPTGQGYGSARTASSEFKGSGPESALPDEVRAAFHRDFPAAAVTSVVPIAGPEALYRIVFISGGRALSAVYNISGRLRTEDSSGVPEPAESTTPMPPATRPSTQPSHSTPDNP